MSSPFLFDVQKITAYGLVGTSGTTLTAHASANTKGSYAELTASTSEDIDWMEVHALNPNGLRDCLIDIAIGAAASEQVIVENILVTRGTDFLQHALFQIPLRIPAGTRISARMQSTTGGATLPLLLYGYKFGALSPGFLNHAVTYGANTGDSGGTSIDPGASAGTKGSYSQITAATTSPIKWLIVLLGNQNNADRNNAEYLYDIAIGAGGSEQIIISNQFFHASATGDNLHPTCRVFPISIPTGTRLAMRASSSTNDATDRLFDVVLIGVG